MLPKLATTAILSSLPKLLQTEGMDMMTFLFKVLLAALMRPQEGEKLLLFSCSSLYRPIVGFLTFGDVSAGGWYSPFETERRIALTIHELVHVLGFRDTLFPYFINPDTLEPLTGHFL